MNFVAWQGATRCVGGPRPGASELMSWTLANYRNARSMGIYSCRPVRGSTSMSIHSEGRALDIGFPVVGGMAHADGTALLRRLGGAGRALGIQTLIWDRKIYSARSPLGRAYTGLSHIDHIHCELSREAGDTLTVARIVSLLGGSQVRRVLRLTSPTMKGADVREVQGKVGAPVDGVYGPMSRRFVSEWQARNGLAADGVVGPATWAALDRV